MVQLRSVPPDGVARLRGARYQAVMILLTIGATLLSALMFPVAAYTFWVLLTVAVRVGHLRLLPGLSQWLGFPNGVGGLPLDLALLLGLLASGGVLYLIGDHLAVWGIKGMRRLLRRRAERLLRVLPDEPVLVEWRTVKGSPRILTEIGLLFLLPDSLLLVGDTHLLTVPRAAIVALKPDSRNPFDLGAAWMRIELGESWGILCLSSWNGLARLSETAYTTRELKRTIQNWRENPDTNKSVTNKGATDGGA